MYADELGRVLVADSNRCAIRSIDLDGTVQTVAGDNGRGYAGDGGPAHAALLALPTGVAVDGRGRVLIADRENDAIRMIDRTGVIHSLVGGNGRGYTGDGGPAHAAQLHRPRDLAVRSDGAIWFTDRDNHAIRKVDREGVITTVAGGNGPGYTGDGGPARDAALRRPRGCCFGPTGDLYVADRNNHAIRKVDREGVITTVAGGNGPGYTGDGDPAQEAQLDHPSGVAVDAAGCVFVSEHLNHAVRRVDGNGSITTVAGGNGPGYTGDGGPAHAAQLDYPSGVSLGPRRELYIADRDNHAIRVVQLT